MPVPLILGVAAAIAAASGVGAGANAVVKNKEAQRVNEDAQGAFEVAKKAAEKARDESYKSLERLGNVKLKVLDGSIKRFIETFEKIHSIHLKDSAGIQELGKFHLDHQKAIEMKEMSQMATSVIGGVVGGAGAGALAAFGAYSATMTFAAASTGTAIASLSGAAATNATLAFLGGGALAAGGGGMALGSVVLGGAVAGPAIAVLGIVMNATASKNLDNAYSNRAKAEEEIAGLRVIESLCNGIMARADMFTALLKTLNGFFDRMILKLEGITEQSGCDYSLYTEEEQSVVAMALSMAGAIKQILDTPILKDDGSLTEESKAVYDEVDGYTKKMGAKMAAIPQQTANGKQFSMLVNTSRKVGEGLYRLTVEINHTAIRVGQACRPSWDRKFRIERIFVDGISVESVKPRCTAEILLWTGEDQDLEGHILFETSFDDSGTEQIVSESAGQMGVNYVIIDKESMKEDATKNEDTQEQVELRKTKQIKSLIDGIARESGSFYKSAVWFSKRELEDILRQMTFAGQEQTSNIIALYDITPRIADNKYSGILFMKEGFYFKQKDHSPIEYMSYSEIRGVREKFAALVIYGNAKTIEMKSTSYAQPRLTRLFWQLRKVANGEEIDT